MKCDFFKSAVSIWLICLLISLNLADAANQKQPTIKLLNLADIQQRIQVIKDRSNLNDDLKKRILADYYESDDNLAELASQDVKAEEFKQSIGSLPLESKRLQQQIGQAEVNLKNRKTDKFAQFPIDELEQRLIVEKSRLSDLDAEISRNESQINELVNRPQVVRERIAEIKAKQSAAQEEQMALQNRPGSMLIEKEARQALLETRLRLANSSLKALEMENISAPMRLQLQKDRQHLLSLDREQLTLLIDELDNLLIEKRQQEISKEQAELLQAEKDAEGKPPLIRAATQQNMGYNRSLQDVNKSMEQYLFKKNEIEVRNKQLEKDFHSAEQKINLAGLSPVLGNLLREQRRNLPQRNQFGDLNENIQHEIAVVGLETFKLDEAKKQLADVNQALLAQLAQSTDDGYNDSDKLSLRTELRMLLNDQKDLVVRLSAVYAEYSRVLGDVDFNLQQMLTASDKFGAYLDQRLLWVPSAPVISEDYLNDIFYSLLWFLNPANWLKLLINLAKGITSFPWVLPVLVAVIGLHWRYKKAAKQSVLKLLSKNGNNPYASSFGQLLLGLAAILWLTLHWPMLMIWVAWVLDMNHSADMFSHAIANGLISTAVSLTVVQFFYRIFRPEGVAQVLFLWQQHTAQLIFQQLQWSRFVVLPCIFMIAMTGSDLFSEHSYALGRTAQIVMMLALAYVFHRLCHPLQGLGKSFYANSKNWFSRLRYVWYGAAVAMPLVVIGFAVAGYYQSALELQDKLVVTLRLLIITVFFYALAIRWLDVTKRQLVLHNARQKRKQADLPNSGIEGVAPVDENIHDISKINQQSNKLLTTIISVMVLVGLWMIWSDILPAFSFFERVELWQYQQMLEGKEVAQSVTLVNVFICLLYAGLTAVFVSNFPALVDLLSVDKFAMAPGSRYALIQLVRYSLISIAFLAIANELGGSWSQVQWLVAALSVGLGFGLQEIFANMVSGIILLFERPIRVGDTVTVGNVTGRVSRIQMRATHIVDWDRKELVVPNKIFITDQLINWTLSDTVTRVVMDVGVAYGCDTDLVERILKEAIHDTTQVLDDPEPTISFISFGESSLGFRLNVFVRELSERIPVTHELHKRIYAALRKHHIEIPFPQRDVHIRSVAEGIMPR
jgi:potassium efflux system protein